MRSVCFKDIAFMDRPLRLIFRAYGHIFALPSWPSLIDSVSTPMCSSVQGAPSQLTFSGFKWSNGDHHDALGQSPPIEQAAHCYTCIHIKYVYVGVVDNLVYSACNGVGRVPEGVCVTMWFILGGHAASFVKAIGKISL